MERNPDHVREFSAKILDALRQGRKVEAIKLLREESALDLKGAKEAIEAFIEKHPEIGTDMGKDQGSGKPLWKGSEGSLKRLLKLAALFAIVYVLYRMLS